MRLSLSSYSQNGFSKDNAALVLIDHQARIIQLVHDYSPAEFFSNMFALVKVDQAFDLLTILTSTTQQVA